MDVGASMKLWEMNLTENVRLRRVLLVVLVGLLMKTFAYSKGEFGCLVAFYSRRLL